MPTELTPPLPPATGTITLTNGSATVSGTGTGLKLLRVGDALLTANGSVVVVDVKPTANDSATITKAFSGATETNVAYTIVPRALNAQAAAYFELLSVALTAQEGRFVWLWNPATAAGDPGTGKIQANHATWTSATALYLSDTDQQSNGLGTWLATWGASKVVLTSLDRPSVFAFATLGTVTDSTGYRTITLSALIGAPDFNADERIVVALLPAGATGPQGVGPGITLTFDDPTADADPGAGRFRLNNATHASATAAYIDDAAANGAAITTWLDALDDSTATIKGQLTIVDKADAAVFRIYNVTGTVVNGTGYRKVTIAYVTGAGTLADETPCSLTFSRTGNNGTNGISFIWRGAYSGATAYAANDAVSDQSSTWVALQATTGNAPPSLPTTSNAYWELMAKAGADGADIGNASVTWNDAGTVFTAIKMNVTDTASAADSKLIDLQVGGNSKFNIGKDGDVEMRFNGVGYFGQFTPYAFGLAFKLEGGGASDHDNRFELYLGKNDTSAPEFSVRHNGNNVGAVIQARNAGDSDGMFMGFNDPDHPHVRWGNAGPWLVKDGTAILSLRNPSALSEDQHLRIFSEYSSTGANEFLRVGVGTTNRFAVRTVGFGGGVQQPLDLDGSAIQLQTGGTVRWQVNATGLLQAEGSNNTFPALKRSGTAIQIRLADDSAFGGLEAATLALGGVPVFPNIPQNSQSANYTLVLADAQKHILHPAADNNPRTITIPANASVAFAVGTAITFVNEINSVTIAITSDTLTLAGAGSTGSRTLAANGMATAIKITSTKWIISGVGLT